MNVLVTNSSADFGAVVIAVIKTQGTNRIKATVYSSPNFFRTLILVNFHGICLDLSGADLEFGCC